MRIVTAEEIEAIERIEAEPGAGERTESTSGSTTPPNKPDSLLERAIGLIPGAAITAWISLTGLAPPPLGRTGEWITLLISWIVCVGVLWRATKKTKNIDVPETKIGKRSRIAQILIPTLMFPFYIYTIGGPFDEFVWYDPSYGTYILVAVLALTSVFFPNIASIGVSQKPKTSP